MSSCDQALSLPSWNWEFQARLKFGSNHSAGDDDELPMRGTLLRVTETKGKTVADLRYR